MTKDFCDLCGIEIKGNTYLKGIYYVNGVPYEDFLICQECMEAGKKAGHYITINAKTMAPSDIVYVSKKMRKK